MGTTALAAVDMSKIFEMSFEDIGEIAEIYGFADRLRGLRPHNVEQARAIAAAEAQKQKDAAYGELWKEQA